MSCRRLYAALVLALLPSLGSAATTERLTDEQVKKLIQDIDIGYDTWKKGLEKENLDDAVITSAERTIRVKSFLEDFEKAIDGVKDRFKPDYAASPEVLALLRRGSDVELHNRRQGRTPSSEWPALATKLGTLAAAYGVGWPVQSMNVQASRLNDGELAARVEQVAKGAKALQGETEKAARANKSIDKAARESLKRSIQGFEQKAKDVQARLKEDRPASVEVGQLLSQARAIKETQGKLSLPATASWQGIDAGLEALARSFDMARS